jgi:hypothetical protein
MRDVRVKRMERTSPTSVRHRSAKIEVSQSALRKPPEGRHRLQQWIVAVLGRIGYHKTLVAIANKHARIIWALLVKGEAFDVRWLAQHAV